MGCDSRKSPRLDEQDMEKEVNTIWRKARGLPIGQPGNKWQPACREHAHCCPKEGRNSVVLGEIVGVTGWNGCVLCRESTWTKPIQQPIYVLKHFLILNTLTYVWVSTMCPLFVHWESWECYHGKNKKIKHSYPPGFFLHLSTNEGTGSEGSGEGHSTLHLF